jgi:DNA-binding MarR family transcriptional regulator
MSGKLQQELKKKRPFASLEQEVVLNLWRTSDQLQNRFGRLFRQYGLTPSQYNVLRILSGEGKPLPCLEIAERMIQVVPAITGLLDRLEMQGLVQRQRSSDDRRVIHVDITEQARKILGELDRPVLELHAALIGHLSRSELKELNRLLEKSRDSVCPDRAE